MTNLQEQRQAIREVVGEELYNRHAKRMALTDYWMALTDTAKEYWRREADRISDIYTEEGAVLKIEGALPEVDDAYKDFGGNDSIWGDSQQAMVDAGYTRSTPLVEPEKSLPGETKCTGHSG